MKIEIHFADNVGNIITTLTRNEISFRGNTLIIPRGFRSDGASIPRFLWGSVSPQIHPETLRAALAHDYIYRTQPAGWTRKDADILFFSTLVEDRFPICRALKAYLGVRLFGGFAWNENNHSGNSDSKKEK